MRATNEHYCLCGEALEDGRERCAACDVLWGQACDWRHRNIDAGRCRACQGHGVDPHTPAGCYCHTCGGTGREPYRGEIPDPAEVGRKIFNRETNEPTNENQT